MKHTVVYTSDVHGNEIQYQLLFDYATKINADSVIIGGDIAPKAMKWNQFISGQRQFLEQRLPKLISPWKQACPSSRLFVMMGNDDAAINIDVLQNNDSQLYHLIHGKRLKLTQDFEIAGYSYVPITPFGIKDWEKYDFSKAPAHLATEYEQRKMTNYNFHGYKSTNQGWVEFTFTGEEEQRDSIQHDLTQELYTQNPAQTLYVIHTPPNNTNLDRTFQEHVGSIAVREFIEKHQPYATLSGHIHETVEVSGQFKDCLGRTICISSGNHNVGKKLALISFDLYHPEKAQRLILSVEDLATKTATKIFTKLIRGKNNP